MQLIPCPWCGPRAHIEFRYHCDAQAVSRRWHEESDAEWQERTWLRGNQIGWHHEIWQHTDGCRGWLVVTRNNLTHGLTKTVALGPAGLSVTP